jgi:hypothetical protein
MGEGSMRDLERTLVDLCGPWGRSQQDAAPQKNNLGN